VHYDQLVTLYLSQNQILKKLDISNTFSKSVPEMIRYIRPSSDIFDRSQFSGEILLSLGLSDISDPCVRHIRPVKHI
jgi:hypothetical protein